MQFCLILTSLFCFTTWRSLVQASNGSPNGCPCTAFSKVKIEHYKIEKYTNQKDGICTFSAVAFHTVKGKMICSDPNDEWAKHVILQLEKRRQEKISPRGTPPQTIRTSAPSTSTSPPWSGPSSTSSTGPSLGSESTSDLTSAPSTKTSTSSTASSSTTLTSASTQSTPNPTSATTTSSNPASSTSGATTANDRIPATSMKTRKASTRRQRTRKRPKKKNMKKWQRRC